MVLLVITILIFLAILIISHELGHFFTAKKFGVRIDEFGFGLPPRVASRKIGETKFSLNILPIGGFVKIHGQQREEGIEEPHRAFINQPIWRRAVILTSGVAANFLIGWIALGLVFSMGIPSKLFIAQVIPGSAAQTAGLKVNESIAGWNSSEEFISFVQAHRGESITVNNKTVSVPQEGIIGVRIEVFSVPKENFPKSAVKGFEAAVGVTVGVAKAAGQIIAGALSGEEDGLRQVSGPVGIFNIIKEADGAGLLIYLLGVISLNLAVFNLLPVPALDGGHLLLLGIEKIIGRPIPRRAETVANAIGFALLILLIIMVTYKDIAKL
ncbi:MAG: site-2 protease family protein [Candidatus Colwellbacteria bacterium]|nr:site-2 protease family protein [Candidatus Colwellbacteria bacterium]